jgi:hypothetical protein
MDDSFRAIDGGRRINGQTETVPGSGNAAYVLGPLVVAALLGTLLLIVRWAFARGSSLVTPSKPEYGLLVSVATTRTAAELKPVRTALTSAGIRFTMTVDGDRRQIMVWPDDADRARDVVRRVIGGR